MTSSKIVEVERYAPVRLLGSWDKEILRFANGLVSDELYRNNPGRQAGCYGLVWLLPSGALAGISRSASCNVGSCFVFLLPHTPAPYFKDEVRSDHRADAVFLDGLLSLSKVMMGKPIC